MKKKLSAILALLLAMSMALSACGGSSAPETSGSPAESPAAESLPAGEGTGAPEAVSGTSDETLRVAISSEPANIFPLAAESGDGHWIDWCIYDRLVNYDSDTGELVPGLATSWEWIDDYHLRLTLREDVVAYDGTIINANDVLYSLKLGLAGDATAQWSSIDGNESYVEDDFTFVLGLKEVFPSVISKLSYIAMLTVVDESSIEALGGYDAALRNPKCTSGPYFFDEWVDGEYIRIVRNDNYWGEPGYYQYIEFSFIEDTTSRTMAVASGDVDIACEIDSADLLAVESGSYSGVNGITVSGGGTFVLFFNTTNEYLSNELVREAIYYAVDKDYVNQVATNGTSTVADSLISSISSYYKAPDPDFDTQVDVQKAKELLAEAGYPNGFELYMPTAAGTQTAAEAVQSCLEEIGIKLNIETVEIPVFLGATDTGDYDLIVQPTFSDDIVNYVRYLDNRMELATRGGGIVGGFEDLYDTMDACKFETDEEANMAAWGDLQDYVREHYVSVPLYETTIFYCAGNNYSYKNFNNGHINMSTVRPSA